MLKHDRFLADCSSWSDFWERTKQLPTQGEKGAVFERLTQLYLQTIPEYRAALRHVWTLREVPPDVRKLLNLPTLDEGIDFIACTRHGEYWAIQSKFRSQRDKPLNRKELGTFSSLAFNTCSNIALAVVAHTCSKPVGGEFIITLRLAYVRPVPVGRGTAPPRPDCPGRSVCARICEFAMDRSSSELRLQA